MEKKASMGAASPESPQSQLPQEQPVDAVGRRPLLKGSLGLAAAAFFRSTAHATASELAEEASSLGSGSLAGDADASPTLASKLGFTPVPVSSSDTVVVPEGYEYQVLYAWGDPISDGPAYKPDAKHTWMEQSVQAGMHHDGMQFFPLPNPGDGVGERGLLAINHEYTDEGLLHPDGTETWDADKVKKSQAAHGVSVIEVKRPQKGRGAWEVVRPSGYARRITADTSVEFSGPAAGGDLLRSGLHPDGMSGFGTLANCSAGKTPWGTYLTCEENFQFYFSNPWHLSGQTAGQQRYGLTEASRHNWEQHDPRFDLREFPHEPNQFGWVVEIDPFSPERKPVKRTALGRFSHENAAMTATKDGRCVVYMGDDSKFEYIYKFVSSKAIDKQDREANWGLLDEGDLYAARFDADGTGVWLKLDYKNEELSEQFCCQADVLVHARMAAELLGATPMDRPEWVAVRESTKDVFVTLTNNSDRGKPGKPGADAANPRERNAYGQIVRWKEREEDPGSEQFDWNIFLLAGDPTKVSDADKQLGHPMPSDEARFGSPDGLMVDKGDVMWVGTDVSSSKIGKKAYERIGNNQLLAVDPDSGDIRRFLTGPRRAEVTGATLSEDLSTLFVNIQHPGEPDWDYTDPKDPSKLSSWPSGGKQRPRSATVAVWRKDGGQVGR